MPNGFQFKSPLNRLLSETVPRFLEGQLQRESRERMAMEELSFREEQNRLDRLQRSEEADLARQDRDRQSQLDRLLRQQQLDINEKVFNEEKRARGQQERRELDDSILESLDNLPPEKFLERTATMKMSSAIGAQELSDKRFIAQRNVDSAVDLKAMSNLLLNPRAKAIYERKLDTGDIEGALQFLQDTPNNLSPEDQLEANFIFEDIKSLGKQRIPGNVELNKEIDSQIESSKGEIRKLFAPKKEEEKKEDKPEGLSSIENKIVNVMSKVSGKPKSSFLSGGENVGMTLRLAQEVAGRDLSDAELLKIARDIAKEKPTGLDVLGEAFGRIGEAISPESGRKEFRSGRQF